MPSWPSCSPSSCTAWNESFSTRRRRIALADHPRRGDVSARPAPHHQSSRQARDAAAPQGVRYASCKLPDGETFVILLELDDDADNPLLAVPAFRDFQATLQDWIAEPPAVEQLTPVGSYRLF